MKKRRNDIVQIEGQMNLFDLHHAPEVSMHCGNCVCESCLYYWSSRCPYGDCYDDRRAKEDPYSKAHPEKPPRKGWTDWNKPGEQEHWCRGGAFYPTRWCWHYVRYKDEETVVKWCLESNVDIFQDGYIRCTYTPGCEECYQRFEERLQRKEMEDTE